MMSNKHRPAGLLGLASIALVLLAACEGLEIRPGDGRSGVRPQPTGCPPGLRPIGTLAVVSDVVFRNGRQAANGARVCDGDIITTSASGVAVVLPDNDRESDSVHIAEATDPRFTWTQGGCLSIDGYAQGRIIATAQRRCMIVRTNDTLMLINQGRVQFSVARGVSTQVVPVRGSYEKLQNLTPQEVRTLSQVQLMQRAAPKSDQPQLHTVNEYQRFARIRPPIRLSPLEIKRIDGNVFNRTLTLPPPRPVPDIR
jgi:hypothetical protein